MLAMIPVNLLRLSHPLFIALWIWGGKMLADLSLNANYGYHGTDALWRDHVLPLALMFIGGIGSTTLMFLHQWVVEYEDEGVSMRILTVMTGFIPAAVLAFFGAGAILIGFVMLGYGTIIPLLIMLAGAITLPPVLIRDFWA